MSGLSESSSSTTPSSVVAVYSGAFVRVLLKRVSYKVTRARPLISDEARVGTGKY